MRKNQVNYDNKILKYTNAIQRGANTLTHSLRIHMKARDGSRLRYARQQNKQKKKNRKALWHRGACNMNRAKHIASAQQEHVCKNRMLNRRESKCWVIRKSQAICFFFLAYARFHTHSALPVVHSHTIWLFSFCVLGYGFLLSSRFDIMLLVTKKQLPKSASDSHKW